MYKILTASADAYITNKVISTSARAIDANMGNASTIDIFKLYDESTFSGHPKTYIDDTGTALLHSTDDLNVESIPVELSRGLVKFDLSDLETDIESTTGFSATLKMYDVFGGQTTPSNFSLLVVPLAVAFDEGGGRDVESFNDLDTCNFVTASYSDGTTTEWGTHSTLTDSTGGVLTITQTDAGSTGNTPYTFTLGSDANIVGELTGGTATAAADADIEVGSQPRIISADDSFQLITTAGTAVNIVAGSDFDLAGSHTGADWKSLASHINSLDKFSASYTANEHLIFNIDSTSDFETGYNATQEFETGQEDLSVDVTAAVTAMLTASGSITNHGFRISFISDEEKDDKTRFVKRFVSRHSNDKNKTPRLIITTPSGTIETADVEYANYQATILNLNDQYTAGDKVRLHIFVEDRNYNSVEATKLPIANTGVIVGAGKDVEGTLCYSIIDSNTGDIIIPFDDDTTLVSFDSDEMHMILDTAGLIKGFSYKIKFRLTEDTDSLQYTIGKDNIFKVV